MKRHVCGAFMLLRRFEIDDVKEIVDKATIYDENIRLRVIELVMQTRRRYEYLFS